MKQLNKHIVCKKVAFASIVTFAVLALITGSTEHLGWLLILITMGLISISWFVYEEGAVERLTPKKSNRTWIR